ncbi:MAG: EF-P lysine aminoacylase GenX [Methylobacterium sp.]|nr:EF-P lysine aminoacylase GenX [Methylobacterium sp.]MCA3640523.1 EF-P lysine aminoacylase GenX [Methylobacterium sp.]
MPATPFWHRETHQRRRPALRLRARLKAAIRAHFEGQGFWEVETGLVQVSPGNETHLHAFEAHWVDAAGEAARGYLHTSPEFAMKKLLAAGEERLFQFAPVFRAREASRLHAPEFVMLEWYRAGEDYSALMADCAALLRLASEIGGRRAAHFRDRRCDLTAEPERLSLVDAFLRHAAIALEPCLADRDAFAAEAKRIGMRVAPDDTWGDIFSRILTERIEPFLGQGRATILDRYPVSEAALARACRDDPRFAERFELYVCGIELANAFGELNDPTEQRRRFEADMAEKQRLYGESYPLDEDFLSALAHMPPASGAALGFDRLAMLAAGVESVQEVIATPFPFGEGR